MFNLQSSSGKQIEANLNLSKAGGGHAVRLRVMGDPLPLFIMTQEDGTTLETDGGREVLHLIGGGNPLDPDEQALEEALAEALQIFITAKGF